jgi:hypothetical protein
MSSSAVALPLFEQLLDSNADQVRRQVRDTIITVGRWFVLGDTGSDHTQAVTLLIASLTLLDPDRSTTTSSSSSCKQHANDVILQATGLPIASKHGGSLANATLEYSLIRQMLKHVCEIRTHDVASLLRSRASMYRRFFAASDLRARPTAQRRATSKARIEKWFAHFHYNGVFQFGAKALEYYAFNNRTRYIHQRNSGVEHMTTAHK